MKFEYQRGRGLNMGRRTPGGEFRALFLQEIPESLFFVKGAVEVTREKGGQSIA